jgi:hypothetical protein
MASRSTPKLLGFDGIDKDIDDNNPLVKAIGLAEFNLSSRNGAGAKIHIVTVLAW